MNKQQLDGYYNPILWKKLVDTFSLSVEQSNQLKLYGSLLVEWNKKFNLTAILEPDKIVQYHFYDSLAIAHHVDFTALHGTADIGTGAGFPGIPLKILFPHLHMTLIEVNSKKRLFLEHVIQELGLKGVTTYPHDWRTFLRSTKFPIDCFFARASLQPEELIRIFKPSAFYNNSLLVYWASEQWVCGNHEASFLSNEVGYDVFPNVKRKYVFFSLKKS